MTIADIGISKIYHSVQSRQTIPKESTLFFDLMYYANLLETRFVSKNQYKEFVDAWAEIIVLTSKDGSDYKTLKYIFGMLDEIDSGRKIAVDVTSSKIIIKDDVNKIWEFNDNYKLAEYLAERFAPPSMYRDHIFGKWVKASPETQRFKQSFNDGGSNNRAVFWLFRLYQDGPVRIYVEGTTEAKYFKPKIESMIELYDDILNGDITLLMQLQAHKMYMKLGKAGMGTVIGVNSIAKSLDDYIRRLF
jgi:hypothetical protein